MQLTLLIIASWLSNRNSNVCRQRKWISELLAPPDDPAEALEMKRRRMVESLCECTAAQWTPDGLYVLIRSDVYLKPST